MKERKTIKPSSMVSKLTDLWLDMVANRIKITTYQKYSNIIRIHIIPKLGDIKIKHINTFTINDFTNCMLKTLSAKTVNNILVVLGMIFKFGEEEFNLSFPKIKCVKEEYVDMRVLNRSEQKKLISFLVKDMNSFKLAVLFALYTGVRIGELCALKSEDIIDSTVFINKTIQRIKNGNKTEVVILPPKSNTSIRHIPIPESIMPMINEYKGDCYFISQDNGKFVEPRLLQLKFQQYLNECDIKNANFHTLRHTFATRCVEAGCDVKSLSEMLGHSDVKTTLNKYVHSSFEQKRKNIERLEYIIPV